MKFLCVGCDEPMKLQATDSPQSGTLSAVFQCPTCSRQIAMLTNPSETQMVQSLGVKIGPAEAGTADQSSGGKCPFSDMVAQMEATPSDVVSWTPQALARLENIPDFVRPMAKQGIEHFAQSNGHPVVDEEVLEQARGKFGM